jgi:hypothetical protein
MLNNYKTTRTHSCDYKAESSMLATFIQLRNIDHRVSELMPMCGHLRQCGPMVNMAQWIQATYDQNIWNWEQKNQIATDNWDIDLHDFT